MEGRRRSSRDCPRPRVGSSTAPRHQPSSPRRHRSRHHAVCIAWLSAGLRTHGQEGGGLLLLRRFPRPVPQCCWRGRSQLPLRGSAGLALKASPASLLIRRKIPPEPTGHKIVGVYDRVNTKSSISLPSLAAQGLDCPAPGPDTAARSNGVRSQAFYRVFL